MALVINEKNDGKILEVLVSDKRTGVDYQEFVPRFEQRVRQHGKIRVLFDMARFHGWEAKALWEDIKLDVKHFNDIKRLAVVGEKKWQDWMTTFCKPFTTAKIQYFDQSRLEEAENWIKSP